MTTFDLLPLLYKAQSFADVTLAVPGALDITSGVVEFVLTYLFSLWQALMNASVDFLNVYRTSVANQPQNTQLIAPYSLRLLPLFVLSLLKHVSIRRWLTAT